MFRRKEAKCSQNGIDQFFKMIRITLKSLTNQRSPLVSDPTSFKITQTHNGRRACSWAGQVRGR